MILLFIKQSIFLFGFLVLLTFVILFSIPEDNKLIFKINKQIFINVRNLFNITFQKF